MILLLCSKSLAAFLLLPIVQPWGSLAAKSSWSAEGRGNGWNQLSYWSFKYVCCGSVGLQSFKWTWSHFWSSWFGRGHRQARRPPYFSTSLWKNTTILFGFGELSVGSFAVQRPSTASTFLIVLWAILAKGTSQPLVYQWVYIVESFPTLPCWLVEASCSSAMQTAVLRLERLQAERTASAILFWTFQLETVDRVVQEEVVSMSQPRPMDGVFHLFGSAWWTFPSRKSM